MGGAKIVGDPHAWLDRVIEEQRAQMGDGYMRLVGAAAEVYDRLGPDELDEMEREVERRRRPPED